MENLRKIEVSESTLELVNVKAQLSKVYELLIEVLQKVDCKDDNPNTKILKNSFLEADTELLHYIAMQMDERMLETNYKSL